MMIFALTVASLLAVAPSPSPTPATRSDLCHPATTFTGTICSPGDSQKHAALLMLGGSEGGDSMARAAAAAAQHGMVAASVAYFRMPGLPSTLQLVPVETVGAALTEISKRPDVDPNRIGVLGASKGGEFALLAASTYPQIHAVVADVPSPFAWQGIQSGASSDVESSWTVAGKPLPFVPFGAAMGDAFSAAYGQHKPLDLLPGYDEGLKDKASVNHAFFHLEKIHGPVLFLAGGDDQIWNSVAQSKLGLDYLKAHHHPFADEQIDYPAAGHLFMFATAERPFIETPFAGGLTLLLGGTPQANADAGKDARAKVQAFLDKALTR